MAKKPDNPLPREGSTRYRILEKMLAGRTLTSLDAILELGLETLHARCAELRGLGWPIRTIYVPHPKLANKPMTGYMLDAHFRRWMRENEGRPPCEYLNGTDAGLRKFAKVR